MNNNKIAKQLFMPLALAAAVAAVSQTASAEIVLYDQDDTTFSTDGYINAFYVHSKINRAGDNFDRRQSRVKMGFLPNYIGFNMGKQSGDLTLGARASFWVTINDSDDNGTGTDIDVRQFYGTVGSDWGEVLIGKDFGLFARSNIFLDELLTSYGQVSDTLGLVDGAGVSFGNIGTGYPYAFPNAQITYRSPVMNGFRIAAGIMDPSDTTSRKDAAGNDLGKSYQKNPRFETEVTYQLDVGDTKVYSWVNGMHQTSNNTDRSNIAGDDQSSKLRSKGIGYGVQVKHGGASLTASGFKAKGIHALFTNNPGKANLRDMDSRGYLLQGSYKFGANRVALSHGRTRDDGNVLGVAANYKTRGAAYFRTINDNLTLVAEYNQFDIDGRKGNRAVDEKTKTMALGAVLTW